MLEPAFSTKDATGSILVMVLGMVAEMKCRFVRERQQAGIEKVAAVCGVRVGRLESRVNREREKLVRLLQVAAVEAIGPD